jgi:hypothetical protein
MEELTVLRPAGLKVCSTARMIDSPGARPDCRKCGGCTRHTAPEVQSMLTSAQHNQQTMAA